MKEHKAVKEYNHKIMKIVSKDDVEKMTLYIKQAKQNELDALPQRYIAVLSRFAASLSKKLNSYHK